MPYNSISINKDKDKFFIAICKKEGHSFVMIGVYDTFRVDHILCRIGKIASEEDVLDQKGYFYIILELLKLLFGGVVKAKLKDEGVAKNSFGGFPITYQAYELSYSQYIEFIQLIENLQTSDNPFQIYKPLLEKDSKVTLELTSQSIFNNKSQVDALKAESCKLGLNNNCRHTAISLIEKVTHASLPSLISTNFISALPYPTQLDYGKPSKNIPFYVLPVSPAAYPDLSQEKRKIVSKLYKRMEHMLLIAPLSAQTQKKFQCLKDLYTQLIGSAERLSLTQLLMSIQRWQEQNKTVLNELRHTYFWDAFFKRNSATTKMVNEIVEDLTQTHQSYS